LKQKKWYKFKHVSKKKGILPYWNRKCDMRMILASNSPRRKEILNQLNVPFEVIPSTFEEKAVGMEPYEMAEYFAAMKAQDVYRRLIDQVRLEEDIYILGADTIVYCDEIMGKPKDAEEAYTMLQKLSNRQHRVISGLCILQGDTGRTITTHDRTSVWMRELSDREIKSYIAGGEPADKAGAYAIQGMASLFIEKIEGCYFNVVGLPVNKLYRTMKEYGVQLL
jgi:septum formation protein